MINADLNEMIVNEALRQLSRQEENGVGLSNAGKLLSGAPNRVTPTGVIRGLELRNPSIRFTLNQVMDALRSAGFSHEYQSNKHFYSV